MYPQKALAAFFPFCLALCTRVHGQQLPLSNAPTLFVQCDYNSMPPKDFVVTSPILESKTSSYRAWVQVTSARALNSDSQCYNNTLVWISKGHNSFFRPLFTASPEPYMEGSGMQLVDWSPDGRSLLAELWQWNTEPNDAPFIKRILVFRPKTKSKFEIDLAPLIADQKGKNCFVDFQLLGFTPNSAVALKTHVSTWYDEGDTLGDVPANRLCKEKTAWWSVDPYTQKWRSLPAKFNPIRYAD